MRLVTACDFGAFITYFVGTGIVFKEFANIVQGGICDIGKSLVGKKCLMRSNYNIGHGYKSRQSIVINDMIGIIMEEYIGFFFVYIKACGTNLTCFDTFYQGFGIDKSTS